MKLKEYLFSEKISTQEFYELLKSRGIKCSLVTVYRHVRGGGIEFKLAREYCRVTDGKVSIEELMENNGIK